MAGFEIVADALEAHSKQLDELGARLQGAVDAAKTVSMPTDAYGVICQPFRMMLDPVEQWGLDALQGAVEAMGAAGKAVKDTVIQYREMEDAIRDSFEAGD